MFTGIITDVGRVAGIERRGDMLVVIETAFDTDAVMPGASISCSGVCLTVVRREPGRFAAEVSAETLSKTTLADWREGTEINLERSLRLGDELGGHLVYGHVDGIAQVVDQRPDGDSMRFTFECPTDLSRFIAPKGSVALDGVSLTVNEVDGNRFGINVIPHTRSCTTFRTLRPGHRVNCEIDMLARYVARLLAKA